MDDLADYSSLFIKAAPLFELDALHENRVWDL
jgi:hypothetical protein